MVGHMQATYDTNTFDSRANRALVIDTTEEDLLGDCHVTREWEVPGGEDGVGFRGEFEQFVENIMLV
ncbi:hypothetical protein pipiens_018144 [Culex pipiens pipiens]|uniref:Uncharacterized protein n=1 Tax=Culex pipiens pipiens TaxID=38569 RepID=A0ABD1CD71_CULPP